MLKRLAIVALAASIQASAPMPGQTVKPTTQGSNQAQKQSADNHSATEPASPLVNKPVQPSASNTDRSEITAKDKENTITLTSLPPITVAPITIVDKQKTFWDRMFDWGPWIFNFLLAIAAVLQVWLLLRTWKTIKRQADLTEVTAKRQLRAYLCVDEACVKITTISMVDGPGITMLEGQLNIKNGGQTPAYCVKTWIHGSIGIYPNNIPIAPPPESMRRGEGIVPAQGKSIIVAPETKIAPHVMENLKNPIANVAYYVQGEAYYRDIFNVWHRLKIRMLYGGPTGGRTTKDSKGVTVGFLIPDSWGNYEEDIQSDDESNPN